jgi:hypothetical protein
MSLRNCAAQVYRLEFLGSRPGLPRTLSCGALIQLFVARRRERLTLLRAAIRESIGNMKQRVQEQIRRC